jgi:hypothetical protein
VPLPPSPLLVSAERLRLSAGAIEREHQLAAWPLPQRVLRDEALELADEVGVASEREVGLDPFLERAHAQLVQSRCLSRGERLVGELVQRRPSPHAEPLAQGLGGLAASPSANVRRPSSSSASNRRASIASGSTRSR